MYMYWCMHVCVCVPVPFRGATGVRTRESLRCTPRWAIASYVCAPRSTGAARVCMLVMCARLHLWLCVCVCVLFPWLRGATGVIENVPCSRGGRQVYLRVHLPVGDECRRASMNVVCDAAPRRVAEALLIPVGRPVRAREREQMCLWTKGVWTLGPTTARRVRRAWPPLELRAQHIKNQSGRKLRPK